MEINSKATKHVTPKSPPKTGKNRNLPTYQDAIDAYSKDLNTVRDRDRHDPDPGFLTKVTNFFFAQGQDVDMREDEVEARDVGSLHYNETGHVLVRETPDMAGAGVHAEGDRREYIVDDRNFTITVTQTSGAHHSLLYTEEQQVETYIIDRQNRRVLPAPVDKD